LKAERTGKKIDVEVIDGVVDEDVCMNSLSLLCRVLHSYSSHCFCTTPYS